MQTSPNKDAAPGRPHNISIFNIWGSHEGAGIVACATEFERTHPDIGVRVIFAPENPSTRQRLFTAVAGGDPPDIGLCESDVAPMWTRLGVMSDLTPYVERDGIDLDGFLPSALAGMRYQDRIWHVQWDADANFPFYWNKRLFDEAGLDPDKPPTTIDELTEYDDKITRIKGGRVLKIGIVPWDQYAGANSMLTWTYAFGGRLAEPGTDQVTPDNEYAVRALEWIASRAKRIGWAGSLSIAPPSLAAHPFVTGNLGMSGLVSTNVAQIKELNPKLEFGSTLLPYQPPGARQPGQGAWLGGWCFFIPRNAKQKDAAWEFIKWMSISDQGTASAWKNIGFPTAYTKAAVNQQIAADPVMGVYHRTLMTSTNARPFVVAANFYRQQFEEKVSAVVYGQMKPLQALREIKRLTERETARLKRVG
jgi:multiple sugar transport system substrate-binding protein